MTVTMTAALVVGVSSRPNIPVSMHAQGRIKGGARGAAAPGPAISRGPHFWEVQKIILKNPKT